VEGDLETGADYALANDSPGIFLPMNPAPIPPDDSTYSGRFAARLKELRVKNGLTVPQVLEQMKELGNPISQRSLYSWEAGGAEPSVNAIRALSKVYKLRSPRYLLPKE
jgi:hypothetical protein